MKSIIKIYQIKDIAGVVYAFRSYNKQMFNFNDYEKVAAFEFDECDTTDATLNKIFELGNCGTLKQLIPTMRSISVSDIIEIDGTKYYVDNIGFKKIEEDK